MEISRYLRTRERDGRTVVFHELHPDPVYAHSAEWKRFIHNPTSHHPLYAKLVDRKLLVERGGDDAEFASVYERLMRKLSRPTILYLMLARGCNFACGYCPVPRLAAKFGDSLLSMEDASAGLELWGSHVRESDGGESFIIFYGGEPLLNKPTFFGVLSRIRQMREGGGLSERDTRLMLATNGTLIDDAVVEACLEHDVLVALGLDGPRDANDRLRVYTDGRGSFDDIAAKLRLLNERGVRTAVSASITPFSVDRIDELTAVLRSLGVSKFGLNFLRGKALIELLSEDQRVDFERAAAAAVMRRHRDGNDSYEYQVEKKVLAFRQRDFFPQDCTCYGNQLVIRPDGRVSNCPFSETDFGHVKDVGDDFRIAQTDLVAHWRGRLPLLHPAFRDNDAKSLCGPGCASGAIESGGDVLAPDMALAEFSASIFEELIWSEDTGG